MLAEFKPVDRWLRPDIWLPVMTKTYYFAEKMLESNSGYFKIVWCKMYVLRCRMLDYSVGPLQISVTQLNICVNCLYY